MNKKQKLLNSISFNFELSIEEINKKKENEINKKKTTKKIYNELLEGKYMFTSMYEKEKFVNTILKLERENK